MNESYIGKIEAYLSGEMSRDEQVQFELEKEKNEELASAFRIYVTIETTMGGIEKNKNAKTSFKKILEEANASYRNGKAEQDPDKTSHLHPVISVPEKDNSLYPESVEASAEKKGKIGTIKVLRRFAIAAAIIGIVAYGVTWILHVERRKKDVFVRMEKPDSSQYKTDRKTNVDPTQIVKTELPKDKPGGFKKDKLPVKSVPLSVSPDRVHDSMINVNRNALFAENFKPDTTPNDIPSPLKTALGHYKNEEYKQTISTIDALLEDQVRGGEQTDEEELAGFYTHYYKAQSYLALYRTAKAIPELKMAIKVSPDDRKSSVQWYLALAYLKEGDMKKAEPFLIELTQSDHSGKYKTLAEKLAQQIKRTR